MRARTLIATVALAGTTVLAQEPAPKPQGRTVGQLLQAIGDSKARTVTAQEAAAAQMPEPPEPPGALNAWSLRVHTTGGFTGTGVGSVTISSDGQMSCGPAPCATPVTPALLNPVAMSLASILEAAWVRRTPSAACMDCVRTTVVLKRRDGEVVRVFRAGWDDVQPPSPELQELRRLAFELRAARSAR
jgi:hypothetical protein